MRTGHTADPWRSLFVGDTGQDLVEYALLTMFIGLAGIAAWNAIEDTLGAAYAGYDTKSQGLWEPCDPGAAAPCGQAAPQ